ncbi:MAG: hypothetical protein ABIJ56_05415 [Pseudomonadota bacterium]
MQIEGHPSMHEGHAMVETLTMPFAVNEDSKKAPRAAGSSPSIAADAAMLENEEMIYAVLGIMAKDNASQVTLDRVSAAGCRARCRKMRRKILEALEEQRQAAKEKNEKSRWKEVLGWTGLVLGAVASLVCSVFTGGQTIGSFVSTVVTGMCSIGQGACEVKAGEAEGDELDASADVREAQVEQEVARQMQDRLLANMEDIAELDRILGEKAIAIMKRYDAIRHQVVNM